VCSSDLAPGNYQTFILCSQGSKLCSSFFGVPLYPTQSPTGISIGTTPLGTISLVIPVVWYHLGIANLVSAGSYAGGTFYYVVCQAVNCTHLCTTHRLQPRLYAQSNCSLTTRWGCCLPVTPATAAPMCHTGIRPCIQAGDPIALHAWMTLCITTTQCSGRGI
jgi:hypothetical protein